MDETSTSKYARNIGILKETRGFETLILSYDADPAVLYVPVTRHEKVDWGAIQN